MRNVLVLTSFLLLAGCTDADWDHLLTYDAPAASADSAAPAYPDGPVTAPAASYANLPHASPSAEAGCTRVAIERSNDAALEDFDADTQQLVHEKTYADCMSWATAHQTAR